MNNLNNNVQYVSYRKIKEKYDITPQTLKNWAKKNLINYKLIQNDKKATWLYNIDSIGNMNKPKDTIENVNTIIYVNTNESINKELIELKNKYPDNITIKNNY